MTIGDFQGTVQVKGKLEYTDFLFGPKELIEGKELLFIKQDKEGNCDCMWGALSIVKVDKRDIEVVNFNRLVNPNEFITSCYSGESKEIINAWLKRTEDN